MHEAWNWNFADHVWVAQRLPRIMGIVNVTPDSFSDGGQWLDSEKAVEHALELWENGADILDVGGESTRPGAAPVTADEELRRVVPVIERLAKETDVPISIDTMKADVAEAALAAGAKIINDVSALEHDPRMVDVAKSSDCGLILMHMQGTPQSMQNDPQYDDVVREVTEYLRRRVASLTQSGIEPERIAVDPGIGFGKTAEHNLSLLRNVDALSATGRPVLIGHSRKRFLGKLIGRKVEERLAGTIGVSIALAEQGVDMIRVHDVQAVKDAVTAWAKLLYVD